MYGEDVGGGGNIGGVRLFSSVLSQGVSAKQYSPSAHSSSFGHGVPQVYAASHHDMPQ
jgi:hypothetical protein